MTRRLSAAEFVVPGYPDKFCAAIADALVLEASRVARTEILGISFARLRLPYLSDVIRKPQPRSTKLFDPFSN